MAFHHGFSSHGEVYAKRGASKTKLAKNKRWSVFTPTTFYDSNHAIYPLFYKLHFCQNHPFVQTLNEQACLKG